MRRQLAIVVAIVAGCVGCAPSSSRSPTGPATATSTAVVARSAEIPARGPVAAAVRYVAATRDLMAHSPIGRREILRRLATAGTVDEQAAAFEEVASRLAATLDLPVERLVWVEAPVTASLAFEDTSTASVDVWTVSILGAPSVGSPQQVWRTVHVRLQLDGDRWLVSAASADAGPTPAASELALQSGWAEFAAVAAWPPVVEGVGL